jgi:8-oxo-dGTP diphosphatase
MSEQPKVGSAGILVKSGKYLLGQRNKKDVRGGMWCVPGGGVEFGERLNLAVCREFKEETNLTVRVIDGFQSVQQSIREGRHTVMVFKEVDCDNIGRALPTEELVKLKWFTFREIQDLKIGAAITEMSYAAIWDYYFFKR